VLLSPHPIPKHPRALHQGHAPSHRYVKICCFWFENPFFPFFNAGYTRSLTKSIPLLSASSLGSKFKEDSWNGDTPLPHHIAEAHGAMIGNDLVVFGGFYEVWVNTTRQVHALDTSSAAESWRSMEDVPGADGITHVAFVLLGSKYYMCGGYLGGHPGPAVDTCLVYDHSVPPNTAGQYNTIIPNLPEPRAGGGMVHDTATHSLIFAGGATRPIAGNADADDHPTAWRLDLANLAGGWARVADMPFVANHMSFVTAHDQHGAERHYFFAGQTSENEANGNVKDNYEYNAAGDVWIKRADLPFARGHGSSSSRAISCGYYIVAGAVNGGGKTSDVSYYDIPTDTWTHVGNLWTELNTPVCDVSPNGYMYCESGWISGDFSTKRKFGV
jgi:N-acetylneuraminic acid mutarotase